MGNEFEAELYGTKYNLSDQWDKIIYNKIMEIHRDVDFKQRFKIMNIYKLLEINTSLFGIGQTLPLNTYFNY